MMEIRAEHLTKSYEGRPVLQDVTFTAGAGITRIAGRSGAGKTTLLRILLGLETAESGRVLVPDGCRWAAVFQEDRLLMAKSAGGNLRFALGGTYDAARAAALLRELGLGDVGDKRVRDYSGGMRRRLALARLLAPSDALAARRAADGARHGKPRRRAALHPRAAEEKPVLLSAHETLDIPCRAVVEL